MAQFTEQKKKPKWNTDTKNKWARLVSLSTYLNFTATSKITFALIIF